MKSFSKVAALLVLAPLALSGCTRAAGSPARFVVSSAPASSAAAPAPDGSDAPDAAPALPGMPPLLDPHDVYAGDRPGMFSATARHARSLVYVPNFDSGTVSVIDPATYKVIATERVGAGPQHVVPSWDLKTLWVNNNNGNSLTPIDPVTGHFGRPVHVDNPYNLYFTPDGKFAIVMAEGHHQIVFRDPHTMAVKHTIPVSCDGVNHADFSPDGRYFIVTCEFSGDLIKIDTAAQKIIGHVHLPHHSMPQDIKIAPDGKIWYVADMQTSGVWLLNGDTMAQPTFMPTGDGAHGLYPSRDSKYLYVANRGEGTISVISFATRKVAKKWTIPGPASPDMGGVSADGKVLWLSGRYNKEVYAISTTDGHLVARIPVGGEPHGLCVWPQPGRYSLGHTGILR